MVTAHGERVQCSAVQLCRCLGRESALDWLLPVAVTCLVGLGCHYLTIDTVSSLDAPAVQEKLINMSEEERAQYEQSVQMLRAQGWTMSTCGALLFAGFCRSDHAHCRPPSFS